MAETRWVLVDGNALLYRAFHALPAAMRTTTGIPTNATFGFARMFHRVLAQLRPSHGAVVFDAGRAERRLAVSSAYKAHREGPPEELLAQVVWVERVVEAHGFPILKIPGVEADDVIATLAKKLGNHPGWVVSGDKDLAALVSEKVRMLDATAEILYDPEVVRRKFGVRPDQISDWLALVGDRVDEIAGVPGIGERSGAQVLGAYGTLDRILGGDDEGVEKKAQGIAVKVRAHREGVAVARELARLDDDLALGIDLADLVLPEPSPERLNSVYRALEFWTLLAPEVARAANAVVAEHFLCDTAEVAAAALGEIEASAGMVGVHALIEGEQGGRGELVGLAIAVRPQRAMYFPLKGPGENLGSGGLRLLEGFLGDPSRPKVLHDAKSTRVALERQGIALRGVVFDTQCASHLVDPAQNLPHSLEQVAREYLQRALQPLAGIVGKGSGKKGLDELAEGRAGAYGCHLADAVVQLAEPLGRRLDARFLRDQLVLWDLPLQELLGALELRGVPVDAPQIEVLDRQFVTMREAVAAEIYELAGRPFNIGSPKQLGGVLFDELGLPSTKKTKTGYSTADEVLERLAGRHPILRKVQRWRFLDKLVTQWTQSLRHSVDPQSGRLHPIVQMCQSATGRLITSSPDLQRTPVASPESAELRKVIRTGPGMLLTSADWSQIELRLLAHLSGDEALIRAYQVGDDVHAMTASGLFGVALEDVTKAQRNVGKTVNFGTLYGQGAPALAAELGVPVAEAQRFIDGFFGRWPRVARWREATLGRAERTGWVETLAGRRRYVPELTARDRGDRGYGERIAVNTPVQGSAADLCRKAMVDLERALVGAGLATRMILSIHDEILLEGPEDEAEAVRALAKAAMESVWPLKVPLVAEVGSGIDWASAKPG
jgi:DNA polymerase-1